MTQLNTPELNKPELHGIEILGPELRKAQLSALADDALEPQHVAALVQACDADPQLMQTWTSYHAISDVLRAQTQAAPGAWQLPLPVQASAQTPSHIAVPTQSAANDSVFRWKLLASVVAVAAVGSVLWALVSNQDQTASGQLARQGGAPVPVVATATAIAQTEPTMIRDPRLDELLAAHKQFGGASALQQPAGFLRNATFQPAGR